jgi:TPR repeat protein
MLTEGRGGPVDSEAGVKWLEHSASKGNLSARRMLLSIAELKSNSIFEKLSIKLDIAKLAKLSAEKLIREPDSDDLK